jgi:hypothetical protein
VTTLPAQPSTEVTAQDPLGLLMVKRSEVDPFSAMPGWTLQVATDDVPYICRPRLLSTN